MHISGAHYLRTDMVNAQSPFQIVLTVIQYMIYIQTESINLGYEQSAKLWNPLLNYQWFYYK